MADITQLAIPPAAQPENLVVKPNHKVQSATEMDKAAQDFEAVYLSQMMSQMFSGIEADPNFGGGMGEDTMRSFLVNEYGKQMASGGGIGIAQQMKQQLLQMQDVNAANALPNDNAAAADAATAPLETDTDHE